MLNTIKTYFMPLNISATDDIRRASLFINFVIALCSFSLAYLFICYFTGIIVGVYTNLIMFPLCIISLFVFKHTKWFIASSTIAVLGLSAGIAQGVLFSGNIISPAIPWLIAAPSLAFLLGNRTSGILWTVIISILFLIFGLLTLMEINIPYLFPAYLQNYMLTFTFIAVTAFFAVVLSIYDKTRENASTALVAEKQKSETILLNILPKEVAEEIKETGGSEARLFENVAVLFTDFKSFTETSAKLSAAELVHEINACCEAFDGIIEKYSVEKIKTIGDSYMAAGGLPIPTDDSVKNTILVALEMQEFIQKRKTENEAAGKPAFEMRVGIHTGPVVAGIVGVKKFQYDVWGDTVNTASRMESNGEAGKVNISQTTFELIKDDPAFKFMSRGKVEAKGKGLVDTYFVSLESKSLISDF